MTNVLELVLGGAISGTTIDDPAHSETVSAAMKRAAWTHSFAGLPFSRIALAIRANPQAVDQRRIVVTDLGEVLVI